MTTPQPNPTDDLEAAKAWAERTLRNGLLDRPEDDTHLRTLINALRPAGVGEAVAWRVRYTDRPGIWTLVERVNGYENDPELVCEPLYAHPDAALMDRVRTAGRAVVERWETPLWKDAEPTAHVIAELRNALDDLKAEAGR